MNANGRVNIIQPNTNKQFSLYDKIPVGGATKMRCIQFLLESYFNKKVVSNIDPYKIVSGVSP